MENQLFSTFCLFEM